MPVSEESSKKNEKVYREIAPYLGLGTQLAASIVIMVFLGKWIDEYFNTNPFFLITFALIGGFAGIYNFIKTVLELNEKKNIEKDN